VWLIRAAGPHDAARLLTFSCANSGERWTTEAEHLIRGDVADSIRRSDAEISVLVAVSDTGVLAGVVAASLPTDGIIDIFVLAVTPAYRRKGIGTELKQHIMRQSGNVRVAKSEVHRKNLPMQGLNAKLNAETARLPEDDKYLLSVVRIEQPRPPTN
jgi:ribosomal protein S18 acetylase RimI-like enzyme